MPRAKPAAQIMNGHAPTNGTTHYTTRLPAIPLYPTNSLDFLKDVQGRGRAHFVRSSVQLNVIIVGAGLGGLATACALARRGHTVTVFEQSSRLGEVGAGIQMPPNSARFLLEWGLGEFLQDQVVEPSNIKLRRWKNGEEIGCTQLVPYHKATFGAPYYMIHRAHFHDASHKLALKLGVRIRIRCRVRSYDPLSPAITLADGKMFTADLVIAADGIKSTARTTVLGHEVPPRKTGFAAYRATIDVQKIKQDPSIAWIVEQPNINLWIGGGRHAMTYPIASGKSFNMVLSHPEATTQEHGQPPPTNPIDILKEMTSHFLAWDPQLTKLISLIHTTTKWPLNNLPSIPKYLHPSCKLLLLGDSAHATLPYMSQGAALAVEDGAALAEAIHLAASHEDLSSALKIWDEARVQRGTQIQEASSVNGVLWHFHDGPEQRARDAAMKWEVEEGMAAGVSVFGRSSPNQWTDFRTSTWCFGHDAEQDIRRRYARRRQ